MANFRRVESFSNNDPEVQALFVQWRAAGVNVSRLVVAALRDKYVEPHTSLSAETLEQVRAIREILEGGRGR